MPEIYFLEPTVRFDDQLEYVSGMEMEIALCPLNEGQPSQHAMRQRWRRPLKIVAPVQRMTDFEWTVYRDIIIEEDIVDSLKSADFSGVKFQGVELFTTTKTPLGRRAFELTAVGWGGMARADSGIHVVKECPFCKRRVYSGFKDPERLFSSEEWDGSDFFVIWPMPKYVFITRKVVDYMLKSGYSGVLVKPINKFPKSIAVGYSPGHLDDWFDGQKLAAIKRQFGSYLSDD